MQKRKINHSSLNLLVCFSLGNTKLSLSQEPGLWCETSGLPARTQSALIDWLESYSNGSPTPLPNGLQPPLCTAFQKRVIHALQEVPFGSQITYEELARRIGSPKASRAVGNACGQNAHPLLIPCHRVVRKGGLLGGFSGGLEIKKRLLSFEAALIQKT